MRLKNGCGTLPSGDIVIVAAWYDRGGPVGPVHTKLHATEPGFKWVALESFRSDTGRETQIDLESGLYCTAVHSCLCLCG
jgi:hypothetical protein